MLRWIVKTSLNLRYFVLIIAAGMMIFGASQFGKMSVDVFPEFNPPIVEIQTEALGLSAIEIEALLTVPLEADLLNGVAWMDQIYSESVAGLSSILLVFEPGTDPIRARQMVQERLTQTFALPNVSKPPTMLQPLSTTSRVMMVGISSDELSLIDLGVLARWNIKPRLMGVPGVANVAVWGQREWQLQVQVDPQRLQEAGVTLNQIIATTGEALWVSPLSYLESSSPGTAGWIDSPNQRLSIRHVLPISSAVDMGKIPVKGTAYQLGEIVDIVEDHQPLIGDALLGDRPGLLLVIEKFPGANTLEVTRGVEEALNVLSPGLTGIDIDTTIFRPADYIEQAASNLSSTLIISILLIALVSGIFLSEWRTVVVGLMAILTSLVAAVLVLYIQGVTFNIIILAGLAAAVGIVVDDALTHTENIRKRIRQNREEGLGKSISSIILEASFEIRSSIGFATLVIILVTLPIFFLQGLSGAFLRPLAGSYILAIFTAHVMALIVTPALSMIFLSKSGAGGGDSSLANKLQTRYRRLLERSIQFPSRMLVIAVILAVSGIVLLPMFRMALLPELKQTNLRIQWDGAPGTSRLEMNRITAIASRELQAIPGVGNVGSHVGRAITGDAVVGINSGELWINIDSGADYNSTVAAVQEVIDGYPGIFRKMEHYQPDRLDQTLTSGNQDLVVRIYGHQFDVLNAKAQEIEQRLGGIRNVVNVWTDIQEEEPQIEIAVDLALATRFQIKPGDVRRSATTLLSGLQVGNLYEEQKVFDVIVMGVPELRENLTNIGQLLIDTPRGGHVTISEVADVRIAPTPIIIKRDAVSRFIDVTVEISGRSLDLVVADIEKALKGIAFPIEYHAEVLSDYLIRQETQQRILIVITIVLLGSFLLMQAAFRSWHLAFFTLLSWPVTLTGGVLAVWLTNGILSLGSLLGFMVVLGIVIRNSVVMIDNFQRLEDDEGIAFGSELVVQGAMERFRPILMTALTTGLAFLPLIAAGDIAGLEVVNPMAVVVVGGLVSAILLNLFLLPVIYLRYGEKRELDPGLFLAEAVGD